ARPAGGRGPALEPGPAAEPGPQPVLEGELLADEGPPRLGELIRRAGRPVEAQARLVEAAPVHGHQQAGLGVARHGVGDALAVEVRVARPVQLDEVERAALAVDLRRSLPVAPSLVVAGGGELDRREGLGTGEAVGPPPGRHERALVLMVHLQDHLYGVPTRCHQHTNEANPSWTPRRLSP